MVFTTAHLHSRKSELKFCAGSNSTCGVSDSRRWGSLFAKRLSSVNNTSKTIHNHHHHHFYLVTWSNLVLSRSSGHFQLNFSCRQFALRMWIVYDNLLMIYFVCLFDFCTLARYCGIYNLGTKIMKLIANIRDFVWMSWNFIVTNEHIIALTFFYNAWF